MAHVGNKKIVDRKHVWTHKEKEILWAIVNEGEGGKVVNNQPHHHHFL